MAGQTMAKQRVAGKIIGSILGFAFGGPAGMFIGFVIGHLHDNRSPPKVRAPDGEQPLVFADGLQQSTFTIGVIVLGAKMAKADGRVTREEIAAFKRVFHIPESEVAQIGELFDQARRSAGGYEPYAARLAQVFRRNPAILEEILTGLFMVAIADSVGLSRAESAFLRRVAIIFGFTEADFVRIAARSGVPLPDQPQTAAKSDAYAVLGLAESASGADIKRAYRALIRKHHPDTLVAQGLPSELVAQATEKMKRINAAYDGLCKARGIK
jgi:DnaJ like chaperone protein